MKNPFTKFFLLIIILLIPLCVRNYAQMPSHPSLLEKINRGEQSTPYTLSNLDLIRSKGVDEPWSSSELKMLKKPNTFSKSYGPSKVPSGSWKALAILVQFTDKAAQVDAAYFDNLLFGQSTGTVRDYYEKVSYGNLDIVTINLPSTTGWISAQQTYSYYVNGQNGEGSYPQNTQKLVEDIVNLVDPQIDFSQYDNDGNGYVDALFIIHSGSGAEYTGSNNDIWSHSWSTRTEQLLDGVKVYRYSVEPEYWVNPGDMTCGVFAHEFGHSTFGLPDLYDTDKSSYGLGNWSLMSSGVWHGNNGSSPAFPDAWTHTQMGYITPTIVSTNIPGQLISNVENTPEVYVLQNSLCGNEYFLIENRQQAGYDTYLPGSGLCIYSIDNTVNNNNNEWYAGHISSGHYHVAMVQADGLWELERNANLGDAGDPYPGSINNKNFRTLTFPDSRTYDFNETGIGVSNISSSSLVMSADFKVDTQLDTENLLPQFSEEFFSSFAGIDNGSLDWGDYDNDGYLDVLLTGTNKTIFLGSDKYISKIYHNNGNNTFTEQTSISLTDVSYSSAAWGDCDNDGYLDILLTGQNASKIPISKVYHNNGNNTFTEQTLISLVGVYESSANWGDYDNDGFLDILLTGRTQSDTFVSKIYHNNRDNTFTEQSSISLIGVGYSSVAWGDYDNDGDLDILLTGRNFSGTFSKIYRNNGDSTFTEQTSISLSSVSGGSAYWGDYNNDGFLDILLTGGCVPSKIYRNNGNNSFTEQASISLIARCAGSESTWGDYDNDGYLDILSIGQGGDPKIYHNNNDNTFTEQNTISLFDVHQCSAAWGDYDNDGDQDILLSGSYGNNSMNKLTTIYRNNNISNTPPVTPSNLQAVRNGNDVTFSWDKSTDNETLQNGLTYNLVIGTSPNSSDILSPMSDRTSGRRRIVSMGNAGHCNSWTIKNLPDRQYYWSVQAIDNCFAGSAFASTQSFGVQEQETITITYPAGGEIFEVGSNPIITYSSVGNSGYVNLDYSTDGGVTWNAISTNELDDGDFNGWIIPNTPSTNCKIRISDVDGHPSAISNNLFIITSSSNQFIEQVSFPVDSIFSSCSAAWGDYDNDGDLDILLTGQINDGTSLSKIYRNNGDNNFSEQTSISLYGARLGYWGDYDNDGNLDMLLTGQISMVYRNNGNSTFTAISTINISWGSACWGDYDNDGDLDILISGIIPNGYHGTVASRIYCNHGNSVFVEQSIVSIQDLRGTSTDWGDYDNDGDLDILIAGWTGTDGESIEVTKMYRNNGDNSFTENISISLARSTKKVAWGDYDNDGDLDALLGGSPSKIYRNDGDNTFTDQSSILLASIYPGSAAWGDYDNDGDLDIILIGRDVLEVPIDVGISKIYCNNGDNTFTESISLTGVFSGSVAWGDYDNDGDLDILLTGDTAAYNLVSKIYQNNITKPNTIPTIPNNSSINVHGNYVTFSWDKSTDSETPQNGLTYNLVVGSSPNGIDIVSPMSDLSTGFRKIVSLGNTNLDTFWTIKNLPDGKYYWSVQAIDNCFAGSAFASIASFTIPTSEVITITHPAGGEIFVVNSNSTIAYTSVGNSGFINLDYSTDGGATWDTIATNQLDDGDYEWKVPNTPSTNCKIRVTDIDGYPSAISDSTFTIKDIIPVEIIHFSVTVNGSKVFIEWKTATETNNEGFAIERKFEKSDWIEIGFVKGSGTSTTENTYNFTDNTVYLSGSYSYRLKQIDYNGTFKNSKEVLIKAELIPEEYSLSQNFPNPFNPSTKIRYAVPLLGGDERGGLVTLKVFDVLGNEVATLVDEYKPTGSYEVEFQSTVDDRQLESGVYFYQLKARSFVQSKKMVLIK